MRRAFTWLGLGLVGLIVAAAALGLHTWYAKPLSIDWFYARVFLRFALDDPELLTEIRLLEPYGFHRHNARLTDGSLAHQNEQFARLEDDYATFHRYASSRYTGQDRLSYEIFDYFVGTEVRGAPWRFHNYPVNPLSGIQSELPNLITQLQRVDDARDAEDYVARLDQFPRRIDQVIEGLKFRESRGILPPRFVVEKVIDQVDRFIATGPTLNVLTVSFDEKLSTIPADRMSLAQRGLFAAQAVRAVQTRVLPAYAKLAAYFETLRPKATRNDGVWVLPDGDRYYQYAVEVHTTTSLSADEIHALGLAEVARITTEMDHILTAAGYTEGSVGERMRRLAQSPAQIYPDDDESRARILADYQAIIDEVSAGLDPYFATKPKARVVVKRVPALAEKTAPAAYYVAPALDGSRPGIFFANLYTIGKTPKFGMRTMAYHEAVPGHHLQSSIAQELEGLPIFRRLVPFTAYLEGWGLYAERLAWEAGYEKDPLDNLGRLQMELFRSVRLVVDTGLHRKRWTREQAIDYMVATTGMPDDDVVVEVERYLVDPGQALAYKVGMMKIIELRDRAQKALGSGFDLREFHDVVLANGPMPLGILERVVDEYVARRRVR
ncbi:MAG TPA: DUF885 domain-containing protein [Gemmatimonadaceae bacterium]